MENWILLSENNRLLEEFESKTSKKFRFKAPDGSYSMDSNFLVAELVGNCRVSQNRVGEVLSLILTTCSGWKKSEIPELSPRTVGRMILRASVLCDIQIYAAWKNSESSILLKDGTQLYSRNCAGAEMIRG